MRVIVLCASAAIFGSGASMAADVKKGEENWDGQVALSASNSTGNTNNTVLSLAFDARRIHGRYTHDIESGVDYVTTRKRQDDGDLLSEPTKDRWFVQYRGEIQTGDRTFVYGRTRYEEDKFSGFENRAFVGVGLGHTQIDRDDMKWSLRAGPGFQYSRIAVTEDMTDEDPREESELALYAGSDFVWDLRENVALEHDVDTTWAETNTTIESSIGLKTKITETIATRLNYRLKHETSPPEDREMTDTQLSASVVYGF